jgi:GTP cyclohydrolase I
MNTEILRVRLKSRENEVGLMKTEVLRNRLKSRGFNFGCDDSLVDALEAGDVDAIEADVKVAFDGVMRALLIDTETDPHTKETAARMAKLFVRELFSGRYEAMPKITNFPVGRVESEPYLIGPISIRSACAHHFQFVDGQAWVAVDGPKQLLGLSKFHRIAAWVASRPTVQENLTEKLADTLERETAARGILVSISATHGCLSHRGVKQDDGLMETVAVRGSFRDREPRHDIQTRLLALREVRR